MLLPGIPFHLALDYGYRLPGIFCSATLLKVLALPATASGHGFREKKPLQCNLRIATAELIEIPADDVRHLRRDILPSTFDD